MDKNSARSQNIEKLKAMAEQTRIGGKGTPRRKGKVVHKTAALDDKKLQQSMKKLSLSLIPGIEEVCIRYIFWRHRLICTGKMAPCFTSGTQAFKLLLHLICSWFLELTRSKVYSILFHDFLAITDFFPSMINHLETAKSRLSKMNGMWSIRSVSRPFSTLTCMFLLEAAQGESKENEDDDDDVPELVGDFDKESREEK